MARAEAARTPEDLARDAALAKLPAEALIQLYFVCLRLPEGADFRPFIDEAIAAHPGGRAPP
jgi:hypothetical protein